MQDIFDQVGYIINQYVPELYKFEMFREKHIIYIIDEDSKKAQGFEKYINLKYLVMDVFEGDLSPFALCPLLEIQMRCWDGDLTPLANCPLQKIDMSSFNGDLTPLSNCPLEKLDLFTFCGDYTPIMKCPLNKMFFSGTKHHWMT